MYNFLYELGSYQMPADFWVILKGAFILLFPIAFFVGLIEAMRSWRRISDDVEKEKIDD